MSSITHWKMRTVVGERETRPLKSKPDFVRTLDVLDCGHERPKEIVDSLADALRIGFRTLEGRPVRRRCYDCARIERVVYVVQDGGDFWLYERVAGVEPGVLVPWRERRVVRGVAIADGDLGAAIKAREFFSIVTARQLQITPVFDFDFEIAAADTPPPLPSVHTAPACACPESLKPVEARAWRVADRNRNSRGAPSRYSTLVCLACRKRWRSAADLVERVARAGAI